MPNITVQCPTPGCENQEFVETSMAPVAVDIDSWQMRGGLPRPDSYGNSHTFFEAETVDEKPYECTRCSNTFTADQLIIIKDDDDATPD